MAASVADPNDAMARLAAEIASAMDRLDNAPDTTLDSTVYAVPEAEQQLANTSSTNVPPTSDQDSHSLASVHETQSSSPTDHFAVLRSPSPEAGKERPADLDRQQSSSSIFKPKAARRRSSSGAGVLSRLTSRSSVHTATHRSSASINSNSFESPSKPKLDKAALSQQRSKYKSGVNWNNPDFINNTEEPFEVSSSPVEERRMDMIPQDDEEAALRELASAGGTKAALAQVKSNTIGMPIFPSAQRAIISQQQSAALAASQTAGQRTPYGTRTPRGTGRSPSSTSPVESTAHADLSSAALDEDSHKIKHEEAQRVLQSARDAVATSNGALNVPGEHKDGQADQENGAPEEEESAAIAKRKPRRSFMGFGVGNKDKGKKGTEKSKAKSKGVQEAEEPKEAAEKADSPSGSVLNATVQEQPAKADAKPDGAATPNSTGRRRRFNDTRELNLVASQLAAEALLPSQPVPEARRASMLSVLAASKGEYNGASVNGSQSNLTNGSGLPSSSALIAPQPAFVTEARCGSSSLGGSPRNGSPRTTAGDLPRYEAPRAAFAHAVHSSSLPGSPHLTQSAKISGLPSDMLTGLSDGPYPFMPPRAMDLSDPFGAPTSSMEFDLPRNGAPGARNSLPNGTQISRSRGMSNGSTQTWNGFGGSQTPRRSVLQMTMHSPEQELQGLTKPPKSGKSTPFGSRTNSRAASRQVTPSPSVSGLRELAKDEADKASKAAAKSKTAGKTEKSETLEGGKGTIKGSRMSIFKKNKSTIDLANSKSGSTSPDQLPQQLKPPTQSPAGTASNTASSQYRLSASNDSTTSRPMGSNTSEENAARGNVSAQSLVKISSPSMTSASGSSHDPSGLESSDGGNSLHHATSAVTTPDVPASKVDLLSSSSPTAMTRQTPLSASTKVDAPATVMGPPAVPTVSSAPSAGSTPVFDALSKSSDTTTTKTAKASPPARPPLSPARAAATAAASSKSAADSLAGANAGSQSKMNKLISRFGARGSNNSSSSSITPRSSMFASKSHGHLPSTNKPGPVIEATTVPADNEKQASKKMFDDFRNNFKRDWFV